MNLSPSKALVVLNSSYVPLGNLEPVLLERNFSIDQCIAGQDDLKEIDSLSADLLIILGGPQSPYEIEKYPYLATEIKFIKKRAQLDKPTLCIALGAQLLVSAIGGKVFPGQNGMIIDWMRLEPTPEGKNYHLSSFMENDAKVLRWQNDDFELPNDCVILATNDKYKHQAFRYKKNVLGLQFHPEVTLDILSTWVQLLSHDFESGGIDIENFKRETVHYIEKMQIKATKFWNQCLNILLED